MVQPTFTNNSKCHAEYSTLKYIYNQYFPTHTPLLRLCLGFVTFLVTGWPFLRPTAIGYRIAISVENKKVFMNQIHKSEAHIFKIILNGFEQPK